MIKILEHIIFYAGAIIAALGGIALWLYIASVLLDNIKNRTKMFSYVVEYCAYRRYFKKWMEDNKGKSLDEL